MNLWKGVGIAPGTAEDMYSGHMEAFGVLAAMIFLKYYVSCYDTMQFMDSPVQCFCNDLGVITNVMSMQTLTVTCPNDATKQQQPRYL